MSRAGRVPPVGFPVAVSDAWPPLRGDRGGAAEEAFAREVAARLGAERAVTVSSGRAALALLLEILRARAPEGRGVLLVPAYGCPSLLASAAAARLRVRCVDVEPETLRLAAADLEREEGCDALALVAVHLLGIPERMSALASWARERGVALVDDAAQGFGGRSEAAAMGAGGDAGILSFARGKPLPLMGGGALTAGGEIAMEAARAASRWPDGVGAIPVAAATAGYALSRRPLLFRGVEAIPSLHVGVTRYDPRVERRRMGAARAVLGLRLLGRLESARGARRERWEALAAALAASAVRTPGGGDGASGAEPAFLRFPLLARDAAMREALIAALRRAGYGASRLYPETLDALARRHGLAAERGRPAPGAAAVAERLLALPVHEGIGPRDVERMAAVVARTLGAA